LEINTLFNERFGLELTLFQTNGEISRLKLSNNKRHLFSSDEILFLEKNFNEYHFPELTKLFNKKFGLAASEDSVKKICHHHNLSNAAKGKEAAAIGSTAIYNKSVYVKIRSRKKGEPILKKEESWRKKHFLIWENAHGPIPEGHVIIFADNNKLNVSLDNLILVSKQEQMIMNIFGLIFSDPELTKTGLLVARLKLLASKSARELKEKEVTA
jgi:hypothetical protein